MSFTSPGERNAYKPIHPKQSEPTQHHPYEPLRRPPRELADWKCENCRKSKKKCVPKGAECQRCSEQRLRCPGLTKKKHPRRTPATLPDTPSPSSTATSSQLESLNNNHKNVSTPICSIRKVSCSRLHQVFLFSGGQWPYAIGTHTEFRLLPYKSLYDSIKFRQLKCTCGLCNEQIIPDLVFEVSAYCDTGPKMVIHSPALRSDLESLLQVQPGSFTDRFDVKELIKHYTALKTHIDELRSPERMLKRTESLLGEWILLIHGFLENPIMTQYLDFVSLNNSGLLDDQFLDFLVQCELQHGISKVESIFDDTLDDEKYGEKRPYSTDFLDRKQYGKNWLFLTGYFSTEYKIREEERLWKFRTSFKEQYEHLKLAARKFPRYLDTFSWQLQNSKQAWAAAIKTMRKLTRLESSPKLMDALCFLSVARAMAETAVGDRDKYLSAFCQDLKQWSGIFPELQEVSRFMWEIDLESVPQLQRQAHTTILQLRESVAGLIVKANKMFGLEDSGQQNGKNRFGAFHRVWPGSTDQASGATIPPECPATSKEKEPPDRQVYPNMAVLQETTSPPLSTVVILVTSIIFALVIYFMLGLIHISSTTILGFPNPWHTSSPQGNTGTQATPFELLHSLLAIGSDINPRPFSSTGELPLPRDFSQGPCEALGNDIHTSAEKRPHPSQVPPFTSYDPGSLFELTYLDNAFVG